MKLNRHMVREKALQALFSLIFNEVSVEEAVDFALYHDRSEEVTNIADVIGMVEGVLARKEQFNELIRPHLKRWTVERLPKVNLIIMQIAIFEMMTGQAPGVAINEAIVLTKTFSNEKDARFMNAVLNNVKTDLEK